MKPVIVQSVAVLLAGLSLSCAGGGKGVGKSPEGPDPAEVKDAVRSTNELGFRLYRDLAARERNFIFSPAAVAEGIAEAALATGEAAPAVEALLGSPPAGFRKALGSVLDSLAAREAEGWAAPRTALWASDAGGPFVASLEKAGVATRPLDAPHITAWSSEKMPVPPGLLPDPLAAPGAHLLLSQITGVRGHWLLPFLPSQTLPGTFIVSADVAKDVGLVRTVDAFRLKLVSRARMVELPYVGLETSFLLFFPDTIFAVGSVEAAVFDSDSLDTWASTAPVRHVDLSLPRMTVAYTLGPRDLAALGLDTLCPPGGPIEWWNAAFLDLGQDGSLVAEPSPKAQPRLGGTTSYFYHRIAANRPFLFMVRENRTGLLLLMGRILEPA